MSIRFDGQGQLITVSFYMKEADHPYDAGVTIRKTKAGRPGSGSKVEERWLPMTAPKPCISSSTSAAR